MYLKVILVQPYKTVFLNYYTLYFIDTCQSILIAALFTIFSESK